MQLQDSRLRSGKQRLAVSVLCLLMTVPATLATAQTLTVLHYFTDTDGAFPQAGVTIDRGGNLYGTTFGLAGVGYGEGYKLQHEGTGWILNRLYAWSGGLHGGGPTARLVQGRDGLFCGTTSRYRYGSVFRLKPPPTPCISALCPWTQDVLYEFQPSPQPNQPMYGDLAFDAEGNVYGTTSHGGPNCQPDGCGTVFKLMRSGDSWTEITLHEFSGGDGSYPLNGVIFDSAGSLYGTTSQGGAHNFGTIFKLDCTTSCVETILYSFNGASDGRYPYAGLVSDNAGNLYGATTDGGDFGGGTAFELSPSPAGWTFSLLHSFAGQVGRNCGPYASLTLDAAGNLYGTTNCDGRYLLGTVFELMPTAQPPWSYKLMHEFAFSSFEGIFPVSNVSLDANGNLYGTTEFSQNRTGVGLIWMITP